MNLTACKFIATTRGPFARVNKHDGSFAEKHTPLSDGFVVVQLLSSKFASSFRRKFASEPSNRRPLPFGHWAVSQQQQHQLHKHQHQVQPDYPRDLLAASLKSSSQSVHPFSAIFDDICRRVHHAIAIIVVAVVVVVAREYRSEICLDHCNPRKPRAAALFAP